MSPLIFGKTCSTAESSATTPSAGRFEPLFTTRPLGLGLGFGLTTARTLVENQGGTLTCENEPGVGTRFVITLPAAGP